MPYPHGGAGGPGHPATHEELPFLGRNPAMLQDTNNPARQRASGVVRARMRRADALDTHCGAAQQD